MPSYRTLVAPGPVENSTRKSNRYSCLAVRPPAKQTKKLSARSTIEEILCRYRLARQNEVDRLPELPGREETGGE